MVQVNENYLKLKAGYLFPEIAKRVKIYSQSNNSAEIIKLGIGDVTEPLPKACIKAMGKALDDMGTKDGFRGYGPEQGYSWLREKISEHDFISRGCQISSEEILVSDGSKILLLSQLEPSETKNSSGEIRQPLETKSCSDIFSLSQE